VLPRLAYLMLCRSIQLLALLARGDAAKHCGYQRLKGELLRLGVCVSATAIRSTLRRHGLDPARDARPPWRSFLRQQARNLLLVLEERGRRGLPAPRPGRKVLP
jgi:hypothetical protein